MSSPSPSAANLPRPTALEHCGPCIPDSGTLDDRHGVFHGIGLLRNPQVPADLGCTPVGAAVISYASTATYPVAVAGNLPPLSQRTGTWEYGTNCQYSFMNQLTVRTVANARGFIYALAWTCQAAFLFPPSPAPIVVRPATATLLSDSQVNVTSQARTTVTFKYVQDAWSQPALDAVGTFEKFDTAWRQVTAAVTFNQVQK